MTARHPPVGMVGVGNIGGRINALGYGHMISNRVVDALGDLAGGVRISEPRKGED